MLCKTLPLSQRERFVVEGQLEEPQDLVTSPFQDLVCQTLECVTIDCVAVGERIMAKYRLDSAAQLEMGPGS